MKIEVFFFCFVKLLILHAESNKICYPILTTSRSQEKIPIFSIPTYATAAAPVF